MNKKEAFQGLFFYFIFFDAERFYATVQTAFVSRQS